MRLVTNFVGAALLTAAAVVIVTWPYWAIRQEPDRDAEVGSDGR